METTYVGHFLNWVNRTYETEYKSVSEIPQDKIDNYWDEYWIATGGYALTV